MRPLPERDTEIGGENPRFPETHHSALFGVRGETPARRALDYNAIAAAYWKPVYCYIRARWSKSNEDAKDLTQAFFAFLVEKDLLRPFDRERGTFRTYLRTCLDRFWQISTGSNRGRSVGGLPFLSTANWPMRS